MAKMAKRELLRQFASELCGGIARIAQAVERLGPPLTPEVDLFAADAFVWHPEQDGLLPVARVSRVPIELLHGIDRARDILIDNTRRFAAGFPANNALLWGARGMGKSSLVKAVHGAITEAEPGALALVEIHREDITTLPRLMARLSESGRRCLIFCDDLSFDGQDTSYKSLKAALEGGIEGRPDTLLFYATSNRRHLMPRDMMENERSTAINPAEAVEEKVSLSDRFGLWLGFHPCSQDDYLAMVRAYAEWFALPIAPEALRAEALEWAATRGARSGRVAWQFIQDLSGRLGRRLD